LTKTHIYCVPGLAANTKIFELLKLPQNKFEVHYIEWLIPESINETIEHYAKRMCKSIKEDNVILLGVSFGGIMVQEMSKIINPKKVVLISSVKNSNELPKRLKITKLSKAYKLFPAKSITTIENFMSYTFGKMAKKRIQQYQIYLSLRDETYLKWAVYNVLHWQQKETLENVIHLHGTDDHIFPIKYIKDCIEIKKGSHVMVLTKASKINTLLAQKLQS
jgi:hypothetical protein